MQSCRCDPQDILMGFFCLNHVFHYHLVVLSLRPVLNLSASTWVLDSNSLSFSPLSYLWLSSATLRLSCLLVCGLLPSHLVALLLAGPLLY
jgi:hypothetical protein